MLLFVPAGHIIGEVFNAPGCIHDSQVAEWGGVYTKMEKFYNRTDRRVVVDSVFDKKSDILLIKSSQEDTKAKDAVKISLKRQASSFRQAAEWERIN